MKSACSRRTCDFLQKGQKIVKILAAAVQVPAVWHQKPTWTKPLARRTLRVLSSSRYAAR
jgi:hypothetical protein